MSVVIKCPSCGHLAYLKSDRKYGYCSMCGTRIFLDNDFTLSSISLSNDNLLSVDDYIEKGKEYIKINNYLRLKELAIGMRSKWDDNFYTYLFLAISETGINLIDGLPFNVHMLDKDEIEDDIKARIYHLARRKYAHTTESVFNTLSSFYKDVPSSENKTAWKKAYTSYEDRLNQISKYDRCISVIESKYLQKLEKFAKNDEEYTILSNYCRWVNHINKGKEELDKYNNIASEYVLEDYRNTPTPGNKTIFSIYLSMFVFSTLLFFSSLTAIIGGFIFGFNNLLCLICFFLSASFILVSALYFIVSKKLFSGGSALLGTLISIFVVVVISLGASGTFIPTPSSILNIFFFITTLTISTLLSVVSFILWYKNRPISTNKNNTYIGNLNGLLSNNFHTDFSYKFGSIK